MKKQSLIFISTLLLFLTLLSCKKNNNTPSNVVLPATLSCKVNGVDFVAQTVTINQVNSGGNNLIGCIAFDSLGNEINFAVNASSIGTYHVVGNSSSLLDFQYLPVNQTTFYVFGGSDIADVSFSSILNYNLPDMSISGTFSYSLTRGSVPNCFITQGVFANVKL